MIKVKNYLKSEYINDHDFNKKYTIISPNYYENNEWKMPDLNIFESNHNDYKFESPHSLVPVKIGTRDWHQELYDRDLDQTYRIRLKGPIGFNKLNKNAFKSSLIEKFVGDDIMVSKNWKPFSNDVFLRYKPNLTGITLEQIWSSNVVNRAGTAYYGMLFECDTDAENVIKLLEPDYVIGSNFLTFKNYFIEYIPVEYFYQNDDISKDIRSEITHSYTTKSGTLTADEVWDAGTYYLNGTVTLDNYNITFSATDGPVIIKYSGTGIMFQGNSSGILQTSGTAYDRKLYITSKNDDSLGETITGSTGSPATGDYDRFCYMFGRGASVDLSNIEIRYCGGGSLGVVSVGYYSTNRMNNNINIDNMVCENCAILSGLSYDCAYIGTYRSYIRQIGNVSIKNLKIDSTNVVEDSTYGRVICANSTNDVNIENVYINTSASALQAQNGMLFWIIPETDIDFNLKNIYLNVPSAKQNFYYRLGANYTANLYVDFFIQDALNSSFDGFCTEQAFGTLNVLVQNSIFMNTDTATRVGLRGSLLDNTSAFNCGFYNNSNNIVFYDSEIDSIEADPQLGAIPNDTTIITSGDFPFPDGFAVTNLTDYEKNGLGTFNSLGIDNNEYSMTGYKYEGTDNVTPGIYYELLFPVSSNVPQEFVNFFGNFYGQLMGQQI